MINRKSQLHSWIVLVFSTSVAIITAATILNINKWAERGYRGEILLMKVGKELNQLSSLEWQSIAKKEIDDELIAPLEGITIGNQATLSVEYILVVENLWSFTEYRNRLNMDSEIEKKWFEEIQRSYFKEMKGYLEKIQSSNISQSIKDQIQNFYEEVVEGKNYTSTQFGEFLAKISLQNIVETDPMKGYLG